MFRFLAGNYGRLKRQDRIPIFTNRLIKYQQLSQLSLSNNSISRNYFNDKNHDDNGSKNTDFAGVSKSNYLWRKNYNLLLDFKDREGHIDIPTNYVTVDGEKLGQWLLSQRQIRKEGKMTEEREKLLEETDIAWNIREDRWDKKLELLMEFKDCEGHTNVPIEYETANGVKLGRWLYYQSDLRRRGKLDEGRQEKLEKINENIWELYNEQRWNEMFTLLEKFKRLNGHTNVPQKFYFEKGGKGEGEDEDLNGARSQKTKNLGHWLMKNRALYFANMLDEEKMQQLNDIGVVWNVNEDKWHKKYASLLKYKEREGHVDVPGKYSEVGNNCEGDINYLGRWLAYQRQLQKKGKLSMPREELLRNAGVSWINEMFSSLWQSKYNLLLDFKEREGHANIPPNYITVDGEKLGQWLETQRQIRKQGKITEEREKLLNEAGISWSIREAKWSENLKLLMEFKEREGHTNVSSIDRKDSKVLKKWLNRQRIANMSGQLQPDKQQQLEEVGVDLHIYDEEVYISNDMKWNRMFNLLQKFKEREGHTNVPRSHKESEYNLGPWLYNQRYLKKKGRLPVEREYKLSVEAGIAWSISAKIQMDKVENETNETNNQVDKKKITFDTMFNLLLEYQKREGHVNVKYSHKEDGDINLGRWLSMQRAYKKSGRLDERSEQKLNELGIVWDAPEQQWNEKFDLLLKFKQREGHVNVMKRHKENGKDLDSWLQFQRRLFREGKLEPKREKRLTKEAGVILDQRDMMHDLLFNFLIREGHVNVPRNHIEDGEKLGKWLDTQRRLQKDGKLSLELEQRLNEIGFVWNINEKRWNEKFDLLMKFKKREGHVNVPQVHPKASIKKLGQWLKSQRQLQKQGKLSPEREDRMNEAGVVWSFR